MTLAPVTIATAEPLSVEETRSVIRLMQGFAIAWFPSSVVCFSATSVLAPFAFVVAGGAWLRCRRGISARWIRRWAAGLVALTVAATATLVWAIAADDRAAPAVAAAVTAAVATASGALGFERIVRRTEPPPRVIKWVTIGLIGAL